MSSLITGPRLDAYAAYLVFRHADRAHQRGQLSALAHEAVTTALRTQVTAIWSQLFPGQEDGAKTWVRERLGMFERDRLLSPEAAARIRERLGEPAASSTRYDWGALPLLWRIHLVYQFVLAEAAAGGVPPSSLSLIKEAMHALALTSLGREIRDAGPAGPELLDKVLDRARAIVTDLVARNAIGQAESNVLSASLAGQRPSAALPPRGGAQITTASGTCLICGDAFDASGVVFCVACDTPHHPDCWSYNGRCATFACGCVDAAQQPGGTTAPRFDLESPPPPPRPRSAAAPVESGSALAQAMFWFVVITTSMLLVATF